MKLILTSNGFSNPIIIQKCIELVGKPVEQINVAVINEAYAVEHDDHGWILDDLNRIKSNFKGRMELVNLLALDLDTVKDRINLADVIFVVGGHTDYLMSVFQKTGFARILPELLINKVCVGASAGSMVMGNRMSTFAYNQIFGEGDDYGVTEYMGLVNIAIKPHMGSPYFPNNVPEKLLEATKGYDGIVYGLTDNAAIVVEGDKYYSMGGDFIKIENGSLDSYTDRYGKEHIPPEGAFFKTREGAFTVCLNKGCVLLQWEDYAPNVADLPGGGIDAGENEFQAASREFFEETGMIYPFAEQDISATYRQIVKYYADVDDEYWTYTQTYFLIEKNEDSIFFEGERKTAENGKMRWVRLEDIPNVFFHAMHKRGYDGLKGKR